MHLQRSDRGTTRVQNVASSLQAIWVQDVFTGEADGARGWRLLPRRRQARGSGCDDVQTKAPRINGPSFLYVLAKANQAAVLGLLRQLNSVRP
jgi:hypothetical protein